MAKNQKEPCLKNRRFIRSLQNKDFFENHYPQFKMSVPSRKKKLQVFYKTITIMLPVPWSTISKAKTITPITVAIPVMRPTVIRSQAVTIVAISQP